MLTLHLARGEGRERYFGCNLMQRKVLMSGSPIPVRPQAPGGRAVSGRTLQPLGPPRFMTGVDSTSLATSWSVSRYERRTREERHPFEAC